MQLQYHSAKVEAANHEGNTEENAKTEEDEEISFADESKITFNNDDGLSSIGDPDDEDDDAAEAEAIQLIQS